MIQLTMNNRSLKTIKILLFCASFDKELNLFEQEQIHVSTDSTMNHVIILKKLKNNICNMQRKTTKHVNKKRKIIFQLKKRNKVYLLTKNLKTRKLNKKLNNIKIKSFFIKAIKKLINYKLNLLKEIRIHSIFNILLLKLVDFSTFIQKKFYFKNLKENVKLYTDV